VHVFSRSIAKQKVFKTSEDFESFKKLLTEKKSENCFKIFHYCIMNTHFHLAAKIIILGNFSKALQQIKWHYTRYFNRKHKRWGPLWRERFRSMLIENEEYLYACGQYIELNPVKARMVKTQDQWQYSSARHYSRKQQDPLIDAYETTALPQDLDLDDSNEFERGSVIGSGLFKYKILKGIR